MIYDKLDKYRDPGLLFLRIGIGVMFMIHGFPKLVAGPGQLSLDQMWSSWRSAGK